MVMGVEVVRSVVIQVHYQQHLGITLNSQVFTCILIEKEGNIDYNYEYGSHCYILPPRIKDRGPHPMRARVHI